MADQEYDIIIIGGGPASLAAALYAGRAERRTLVLERQYVGGQVAVTDMVANYPGFPEGISGADLVERMQKQAEKFGAVIKYEEAKKLEVESANKRVVTGENVYVAPCVILGAGADPSKLGVPGEKELLGKGVSYCGTCDGPFFGGKKLVVVGGGDAAIKEALFLTRFAAEVVVVHRRDELRAEKVYQTQAFENPKITFAWSCVVTEILGDEKVVGARIKSVTTNEERDEECDGVFIFIGHIPNTKFLGELLVTDEAGHVETNWDMETSIPGLYAVGDVRKYSYRQIATAVGEGVTAAMAADHRISSLEHSRQGS